MYSNQTILHLAIVGKGLGGRKAKANYCIIFHSDPRLIVKFKGRDRLSQNCRKGLVGLHLIYPTKPY